MQAQHHLRHHLAWILLLLLTSAHCASSPAEEETPEGGLREGGQGTGGSHSGSGGMGGSSTGSGGTGDSGGSTAGGGSPGDGGSAGQGGNDGGGAGSAGDGGSAGNLDAGTGGGADAGGPGSDAATDAGAGVLALHYDFGAGASGWTAGFADYGVVQTPQLMEIDAKIAALPAELGSSATGFMIQGNNHSDDLFMFLARSLGPGDGVVAGRSYQASFTVVFASNAQEGCIGIGGSPDSLWLKVGLLSREPKVIVDGGQYVMNVDKGAQANSGPAGTVLGTVGNGHDCNGSTSYVSLERSGPFAAHVQADSGGHLWLLVGTDSGFEGLSRLYYRKIDVRLTPVP
jgi:hypothetical protein